MVFSGQRGVVIIFWSAQFQNQASAVKDGVGMQHIGTAPRSGEWTTLGVMHGLVNERVSAVLMAIVIDPPAGSFLEAATRMSVGSVNFTQNDGVLSGFSFGHDDAEGPTVTVE